MSVFPVSALNTMSLDRVSSGRSLPDDFHIILDILAGLERCRNTIDRPVF